MQRRHPCLPVLLALLAAVGPAASASAQPASQPSGAPSPDAVQRAEVLFRNANQLYTDKKWVEAEAGFLAAWALNPTYDVAANLGHAQYRLGKYRDAAEHFAFALRNWPLIGKPEPRKLAETRLAELRTLVASLNVQVNVAGAEVLVDGAPLGSASLASEVFVDPGAHVVEAALAGYKPARAQVNAAKGSAQDVVLTLVASSGPPPQPAGPSKPVIITGAVLGGAGVLLGAVFAGLSDAKASDAAAKNDAIGAATACGPTPSAACQAVQSAGQARATFANASAWSFIAGGALGAATVIYTLAAPRAAKASGMRVAPTVTADGGGVVVRGEW
jgi:tetratricopeptide (TPR) repeat protein